MPDPLDAPPDPDSSPPFTPAALQDFAARGYRRENRLERLGFEPVPDWQRDPFVRPMAEVAAPTPTDEERAREWRLKYVHGVEWCNDGALAALLAEVRREAVEACEAAIVAWMRRHYYEPAGDAADDIERGEWRKP
jgi:hypothetical protein